MDFPGGESGLRMTVFAVIAIVVIFASALWFVLSASASNRKFRWLQVLRSRGKRRHLKSVK
ncbi:MAG TPA: hypothetical protein VKZ85_09185 [Woeseiaceae bacterium]|nr:hypothetical protein [Woeseiaceae bacterium]